MGKLCIRHSPLPQRLTLLDILIPIPRIFYFYPHSFYPRTLDEFPDTRGIPSPREKFLGVFWDHVFFTMVGLPPSPSTV